jgi:outer membrane protein assembly factor BamB
MRRLGLFVFMLLATSQMWAANGIWTNVQADAAHTGFVAINSDSSKFKVLWSKEMTGDITKTALTTDTMLYINVAEGDEGILQAVHARSGKVIWRQKIDKEATLAFSDNQIFVQPNSFYSKSLSLSSYDPDTGKLNYSAPVYGKSYSTTPFATASSVYAVVNDEILSFTKEDGTLNWIAKESADTAWRTPAAGNDYIANITFKGIDLYDSQSGAFLWKVPLPKGSYLVNFYPYHVPVFQTENNTVYSIYRNKQHDHSLYAFDVENQRVKWGVANVFSQPVLADNEIFVKTEWANTINAVDTETGSISWSWTLDDPDGILYDSPVATQDHIFIPGNGKVYAVSRETHEKVWEVDKEGILILGNNMLFIIGYQTNYVTAVALN